MCPRPSKNVKLRKFRVVVECSDGKKRRKKRDARANGFFANLNLLLLFFAVLVAVVIIVAWLPTGSILFTRENFTTVEIHLKANIRLEYCTNDLSFSSGIVSYASEIRNSHLSFFASKIVAKFGQKIACMNSPNNVRFSR